MLAMIPMVMDPRSPSGSDWFCAARPVSESDMNAMQAAQAKRDLRNEKRILH